MLDFLPTAGFDMNRDHGYVIIGIRLGHGYGMGTYSSRGDGPVGKSR